jgi:hypothetical protein
MYIYTQMYPFRVQLLFLPSIGQWTSTPVYDVTAASLALSRLFASIDQLIYPVLMDSDFLFPTIKNHMDYVLTKVHVD